MKWVIIVLIVIVVLGAGYYFLYGKNGMYSMNSNSNTTNTTPTATSMIDIRNFAFNPNSISVKVGDTVTFTNNDSTTHAPLGDGGINAGDMAPGESYKKTFNTAGTFNYHCSIHPSMTGTVVAQ